MLHFKNNNIDLLVTPNHKMYVSSLRKPEKFKLIPASQLNKAIKITKTSKGRADAIDNDFILPAIDIDIGHHRTRRISEKKIPLSIWLPFFGLWMAEGSSSIVKVKTGFGYNVALCHGNLENLREIALLLKPYFKCHIYEKCIKLRINDKQLAIYLKQFGYSYQKYIPEYIKKLSPEYLRIFWDWLSRGDGDERRNIYTCSPRLRDDLQEIAMYAGWAANTALHHKKKNGRIDGREIISKRPQYVVRILKKQTKPEIYQRTNSESIVDAQDWTGENVYCVELSEHHTLYVRRNGKALWCGNSRTYHRMAVAIEDAGFIIHPAIGFLFASGFPKATNIGKLLDKREGVKGEPTGVKKTGFAGGTHKHAGMDDAWGFDDEYEETELVTDMAKIWKGHRYSLMAMKPAFEFICVAQKPYSTKGALADITQNGAGALNIDAARIGNVPVETVHGRAPGAPEGDVCYGGYNGGYSNVGVGRWPSNIVAMHLPECQLVGEEDVPYVINRFTDGAKPFGNGAGHDFESQTVMSKRQIWKCAPGCPVQVLQGQMNANGTTGDAEEIFYTPQYVEEEIALSESFIFSSKVTPQERDAGLGDLPTKLYGQSGGAQTALLRGESEYLDGSTIGLDKIKKVKNVHPTLKPIMLNKWLATLLLPPPEYAPRRILVPFSGAGSEAIGAALAGWEEVVGVELEEEYVEIARERVKYWTSLRSSGADSKKLDKRQLSFDDLRGE